ncbi:hypothetical protein PTTG_00341 [Puccinia triticina 1-1 BBBD Race 1]|uniref:FAD_binding_3 domain-containing protein n=1 Tax=Puccinia triticina (isolate 1-1 / race 1 (BBBD)) TaxID=630390 RepID=A0A0C4EHX5_PUCT1|nr:hypothetical protein PTTG_00341 [Puccinia triticina 1-1 BBBD Race 1]
MARTNSFSDSQTTPSTGSSAQIRKVLISGAGVSGPVIAFWLAKAGIQVTVLERSENVRQGGHLISLAEPGVEVLELMGLLEPAQERMTNQVGQHGFNFTSQVEIIRAQLAELLYDASLSDNVEYIFGDAIDTIDESEDSIRVTLQNDKSRIMEYDILIVAEGTYSKTRSKVFKEEIGAPLKLSDEWLGLFSYEAKTDEPMDPWGHWYHIPNCPSVVIRPDGHGKMRVMVLGMWSGEMTETLTTSQISEETKKEYLINLYQGTGWQSEKIIEAIKAADDLYFQRMVQTKCKTWSKGRVVLVGDSGYCPSALTGMGTTVGLVGAYVLAGKIVEHRTDHKAAFRAYEELLRGPMDAVHILPPGYPWIGCPESSTGIFLLHLFLQVTGYIQSSRPFNFFCWLRDKLTTPGSLELPDPEIFVDTPTSTVSPTN